MLWVDRYGNCQLNVDPDEVEGWGDRIQLKWTRPTEGTRTATRVRTYDEIGPGQVGLVTDSYGLLSISVHRGSAAADLGLAQGDELHLVRLADDPAGPTPAPPGSPSPSTSVPDRAEGP